MSSDFLLLAAIFDTVISKCDSQVGSCTSCMLSFFEHFSEVEAFQWHFIRKQFRPNVKLI